MEPLTLVPLIDILKQLAVFFIDLLVSIWTTIPELPNDLKGILIGITLLSLLVGLFRSLNKSEVIQDCLDGIIYMIAKHL